MTYGHITLLLVSMTCFISHNSLGQTDTVDTYLFMGHPRDDFRDQRLLQHVEFIDYDKFDLLLLGGDLLGNTSADLYDLAYCNRVFSLSSNSTHLAAGNHDVMNMSNLLAYTQKPRFYAFSRKNITFLILDTEISPPDIGPEQLQLIQSVTDTLSYSDYLIVVHHRILWMIYNPDLASDLNAVAGSTSSLTSTNFDTQVYPILREASNKGVSVLCLAGDRTNYPISYQTTDGITFIASGMRGTAADTDNHVVLLRHNLNTGSVSWQFETLANIDTLAKNLNHLYRYQTDRNIYPNPSHDILWITNDITDPLKEIRIYTPDGMLVFQQTEFIAFDQVMLDVSTLKPGLYIIQTITSVTHNKKIRID